MLSLLVRRVRECVRAQREIKRRFRCRSFFASTPDASAYCVRMSVASAPRRIGIQKQDVVLWACPGRHSAGLGGLLIPGQTNCELSISNLCSRNILQTRATGDAHTIWGNPIASPRARRARVRCPCTMCASLKGASRAPGTTRQGVFDAKSNILDSPRGATPNYSLDLSRSYGMVRLRR